MTNAEKLEKIEELEQKLDHLKFYRRQVERSDDFAYTNGRIVKIDSQIHDINKQIEEIQMTNDKSPVHDLNGRMVNANTLKAGIYIKNGKKYIK